jgi:hypothetical protein
MEGERVYECKECLKLYDHTPTLCEICLPAGLGDHDPMHNFVSFRYTKRSGADERHLGIQCLECSESMSVPWRLVKNLLTQRQLRKGFEHLDTKTIVRHPHGTFEISMGSLEMEKLAYEAYRKCARHSVKKVDQAAEDLHDGEMGCHCCWERKICTIIFDFQQRLTDRRFHQRPEDLLLSPMRLLFVCQLLRDGRDESSTSAHTYVDNENRGPR